MTVDHRTGPFKMSYSRVARIAPLRIPRRGALAATALSLALMLGACKSVNDVTGSIGIGAPRAQGVEGLGKRYDGDPNDRDTALAYAQALRSASRTQEAVAVLQKAAARAPRDMEVLGAYGKALADAGRYQEAASVLQGAHTPERPNWTVLSAQGSVADRLGEHEQAQRYYQAALKIAPGEPTILSNLGLSYALTKRLGPAEQALRGAAGHPRADGRVRQNLALVLALQGKFDEAEQVQTPDVSREQASANVASIRRMIEQSNAWRDIQTAKPARPR
jgi:Flp pilus assembly protein TadD